jgi:hypothetical protein
MSTEVKTNSASSRIAWNKGRLVGQKRPLRPKEVWAIRVRLQIENRKRNLALFNLPSTVSGRCNARASSPALSSKRRPRSESLEKRASLWGEWAQRACSAPSRGTRKKVVCRLAPSHLANGRPPRPDARKEVLRGTLL